VKDNTSNDWSDIVIMIINAWVRSLWDQKCRTRSI